MKWKITYNDGGKGDAKNQRGGADPGFSKDKTV